MTDSGFIPVEGGSLYYEADGDGDAVVLVHAGVANLRMWDPHVPDLADGYRVVRYDTRGFGRSESDDVEFSNRDDLAAVLDHCGVDSAVLVGASSGGVISLDFTLERPDRVSGLVSVGGGIGGYQSDAASDADWDEVERRYKAKEWQWLADFETAFWFDGPGQSPERGDPELRALVHGWILGTYQAEKEEGRPRPMDPPAATRLGALTVPVLAMFGDLDEAGTQESMRRLAEATGTEPVMFEGAAHLPNLEQPERFTSVLLEFLSRVGPG